MEKINIAELLRNCPQGMELNCTMYDNVYFKCIREHAAYPIVCYTIDSKGNTEEITFSWYGKYALHDTAKCVIFPKGKTTWEGFVPPCKFKEGDVVVCNYGNIHLLHTEDSSYCAFRKGWNNKLDPTTTTSVKVVRLATEEEKQILFDAIKENGYKWNAETKTLEITRLNFKVGDWIIRNNKYTGIPVKVIEFNGYYSCELNGEVVNFTLNDVHNNFHLWTIQDAKDGDVLVDKDNNIGIFQKFEGIYWYSYIYLGCDGELRGFSIGGSHKQTDVHPATKEQRDLLFQKIKEAGYHWNSKTKTLEKLFPYNIGTKVWVKSDKEHEYIHTIIGISHNCLGNLEYEVKEEKTGIIVHYPKELLIPITTKELKFKAGDKVRHKNNHNLVFTITSIEEDSYGCSANLALWFDDQDDYELVPNKFDITTLKPFDNCKYSLDGGITWKYAQYWFIQEKYNTNDISIELWQG